MSNRLNFTKANLYRLRGPGDGKRIVYYDTKAKGLQIRVSPTDTKTFSFYRRVKGGQPERVTLGRFPEMTIEQARRRAAELNAAVENRESPASKLREARREMTLDDLFHEYITRRAAFNKRPDKPRDAYRIYLSHWKKRKLSSITPSAVDKLHKKIGENHGRVTANIALKLLHVMFNKAINEWRIWSGDNPAHGIQKFPEKSRARFLHADELPRFFKALADETNDMIRDYILLSLLTGVRKSNVLAMRWADVNLERMEWNAPEIKQSTQRVTLTREAVEILSNRKPDEPCEYVFPGRGKTGHLVEPKRGWTRILERAEIEDLRIHDLRRTLGSWQAKTGASLAIIGKSLNHKNTSTTAIYARLDLDPVRESVEKATSAILAAAGVKGANVKALKTG